MGTTTLLGRASRIAAAAQASVPGIYAWAVTVAPPAWGRGSVSLGRVSAVVALAFLVLGAWGEWRLSTKLRLVGFWGFVLACALAWSAAPTGLAALRTDPVRGGAGMLAWAIFAFAFAAPVRDRGGAAESAERLAPHRKLAAGDRAYVGAAVAIAASLQLIGWQVKTAERALLERVVALAAGLAIIGVGAELAVARHEPRAIRPRGRRLRAAAVSLFALLLLGVGGLLLVFRD
jgi:hypothetical protein